MLRAFFLFPLSLIYGLIVNIRNFLFDIKILRTTGFNIPVICVGNISVGGTGKTPHVEYIVSLIEKDYRIAVMSRGYKRKTKGFLIAQISSTVSEIGDEARQIKQKFPNITVAVSENRVKGVKKLLDFDDKIELIILDDAFQHRYIKSDLTILMIDYKRPFLNDYYLPYGRLREDPLQRNRADIIIVSKTSVNIKPIDMRIIAKNLELKAYQKLYFTSLNYGKLEPVFPLNNYLIDKELIKNYELLIITGIANPEPFIEYIKTLSDKIILLKYSDHYQFKDNDIKKISDSFNKIESDMKLIITTEKDAMRLLNINIPDNSLKNRMFYIPIEPLILNKESDSFNKEIIDSIKRHNEDYKFSVSKRNY